MGLSPKEKMRKHRARRKAGLIVLQIEVHEVDVAQWLILDAEPQFLKAKATRDPTPTEIAWALEQTIAYWSRPRPR